MSEGLQPPVRTYLVTQVVEALAGEIEQGRLQDELPGELPLCQRLNVSRTTLRAALDILQRRGYLRARRGLRRLVMKRGLPVKKRAPPEVFILSGTNPITGVNRRGLVIRMAVMNHLQGLGYPCRYLVNKRFISGSPGSALSRIVSGTENPLWILASCSAATQEWFYHHGQPAFVHGNLHPGVRLPGFDVDYHGVGQHAASYLWTRGHKHIGLIFKHPIAAGDLRVKMGFLEVWQARSESRHHVSILPMSFERGEILRCVGQLLNRRPAPSALFVINEEIAISLFSCLRSKGVRVPEDISIVVGTGGPMSDCFFPDFTRYQPDFSAEIRRFCHLVADFATHGTLAPTWHFFTPSFHRGATVATFPPPD